MRNHLEKLLALILALTICLSSGVLALAWEARDKYNWYLYLDDSVACEVGELIDVGLRCSSRMDSSLIEWSYDPDYFSHLGGGRFLVLDADRGTRTLTIRAAYKDEDISVADVCTVKIQGYGSSNDSVLPHVSGGFYVTLESDDLSLAVGDSDYLVATCHGGASPYTYHWYSVNTNVARISSGEYRSGATIQAAAAGETRVACEVHDGHGNYSIAYCAISVDRNASRLTGVDLSSHEITMPGNSSSSLSASVAASGTDYTVSWSTSDSSVVSVNGVGSSATLISHDRSGTATVTVTVRDSNTGVTRTDKCTVTVEIRKTSTYNPGITVSLGTTAAGTAVYESLRDQFRSVYGKTLSDSAVIIFGSSDSNIAIRYLSNGMAVTGGTEYTMGQYKGMYTVPFACGTFSTPYTLRYNDEFLTGSILIEIMPARIAVSIGLPGTAPYAFTQDAPSGSGADILGSAVQDAIGGISWGYLRFRTASSSVGTLYADTGMGLLNSGTDVTPAGIRELYFVPFTSGIFSSSFTVYDSRGGMLATGELYLLVPNGSSAPPKVRLTNQNLSVDGKPMLAEIYNINGENYFKLRDIAAMLNDTGSQFSVDYDAGTRSVIVKTGARYIPDGSELVIGEDQSADCKVSTMSIYVNGLPVMPSAFNIGGNHFLRLRDLGELIGFRVDYDADTRTMIVTSR